jgi:hypothetical protein
METREEIQWHIEVCQMELDDLTDPHEILLTKAEIEHLRQLLLDISE